MIRTYTDIANDNVYLNSHCLGNTKAKKLDVMKLRKLLKNLGFNPVANGTTYLIEELKYFFENDIGCIKTLNQAYQISAEIHKTSIDNIQWDIISAIKTMNTFADKDLLKEIFYWYDKYTNITPRFFMATMIDYLNENCNKYRK